MCKQTDYVVLFIECWYFVLLAVVFCTRVHLIVLETGGDEVSECNATHTAMFNIKIVNKHYIKQDLFKQLSIILSLLLLTMYIMYEH